MKQLILLVFIAAVIVLLGTKVEAGKKDRFRRSQICCQPTASPCGKPELSLSIIGQPRMDQLVLRMTVVNNSPTAIVWDSKFTVFMDWKIKVDEEIVFPTEVSVLERSPDIVSPNRFVTLCPGQCLTADVSLSSLRTFSTGHGSFVSPEGHYAHIPTAYESIVAYRLPETARRMSVTVAYDTNSVDTIGGDVFRFHFGFPQSRVNLPDEKLASNEITVCIDERP